MPDLPLTPFTRIIEAAGSDGYSWFDFNGYKFADIVCDPESDVSAGRHGVAMQDVSPMMKFLIKGRDASAFLDHISTRRLSHLKPGKVAYFLMVNEDGFVRDDGTAYRFDENEFLVQSVSDLTSWMNSHKQGFDVEITQVQRRWAELSVYGTASAAYLASAGITGLESLKPFNFSWQAFGNTQIMVSRTGFSGGLGYELMIPWDDAEAVLLGILESAGREQVTFTGNYTGVTLRLDIGFLIPGWDFPVPGGSDEVDPAEFRTPYDMGWEWLVQLDNRDNFVGKAALQKVKSEGPRFGFLAAVLDDTVDLDTLPGQTVQDCTGIEIGTVLVAGFSKTIGKAVAFCNIVSGRAQPGTAVAAGPGLATGVLRAFPLVEVKDRALTPPPGL